jgi:hypothetical protein
MRDLIREAFALASLVALIWAIAFAAIALNPPPLPV